MKKKEKVVQRKSVLSDKYRYRELRSGIFTLEPVPNTGSEAIKFCHETKQIAIKLWGRGAATNAVVTDLPGSLLFQHRDPKLNKERAILVAKYWRQSKK